MKKKLVPTKDRATTSISMRIPVDVLEKLKRMAPAMGMSGYQSLIKYYIGQGMLRDINVVRKIEEEDARLEATLSKIGLDPAKIRQFWKEWNVGNLTNQQSDRDAP
jgi:CopG antitoxin of type II toxin-antitoxin system